MEATWSLAFPAAPDCVDESVPAAGAGLAGKCVLLDSIITSINTYILCQSRDENLGGKATREENEIQDSKLK
jgi:hypothetical protein